VRIRGVFRLPVVLVCAGLFAILFSLLADAAANTCVPDTAPAPPTAAPATPSPTPGAAKVPAIIPVFAPSEDLAPPSAAPTPSPTPVPTESPTPSPAPSLPPCPAHQHHLLGEGPIIFGGTGSVNVGTHISSGNENSLEPTALTQNIYDAGMQFQASRRTDLSSLVVSEAFGQNNGSSSLSGLDISYATPKYIANYGQIVGPADTQLSNGIFDQGLTVGIPVGTAEWDLIGARTTGINNETFRVGAVRYSKTYPSGAVLSQTLFDAVGEQGGNALTLDESYTRFTASNALRLEAALTRAADIPTVADGTRLAWAVSDNITSTKSATSLSYTSIPEGYVALGQIQYAQDQLQVTQRRPFLGNGTIDVSVNDLSADTSGTRSSAQNAVVNASLPISRSVQAQILADASTQRSDTDVQRQQQYSISFSEVVRGTALQETIGVTHQNDVLAGASNIDNYDVTLSKPMFGGYVQLSNATQTGTNYGLQAFQSDSLASFTHQIGRKAQFAITMERMRSDALGDAGEQTDEFTTAATLTRQLSPVVGVQLVYGKTRQSGLYGGSANYFNVNIVGPLAIGSTAQYNGRANPNLPATVTGRVFFETPNAQYGLLGARGLANVLVTLDGGLTQRTDASGTYQFRFVRPGPHIVTITTGTLPSGMIPDTTTQSVNVQGGQTVTVDFAAGQFAGIGGTVSYLRDGKEIGVPGVLVTVDDRYRGYTGTDGTYEIGHLTPGPHSIAIDPDTLPATLAATSATKRDATVSGGALTKEDFELVGLGSINGLVLYAGNGGLGDEVPAMNVYVVAEPGEHAAITGDDGTFIIDNLPPGTYTLSLDADTLPDGQRVIEAPEGPVDVTGGSKVQGVQFKLGAAPKQVVMGYNGVAQTTASVDLRPATVPPNGAVELVVTANASPHSIVTAQSDLWGTARLHYDTRENVWTATVPVAPFPNGDYPVHVDVTHDGTSAGADAVLTVDSALPLVYARAVPSSARIGDIIHAVAKIRAANVASGDLVALDDGSTLRLPEPHEGIYAFTFTARHPLPYRGLIFTKSGARVPFLIGP
jgi:hypothetical protein